MPFKLRYSIESLGGDVDKTIKDTFGYEIIYARWKITAIYDFCWWIII